MGHTIEVRMVILNNKQQKIPIQLLGSIDQVATSRVNDEGFCNNDGIGIYVVNYQNGVPGALLSDGNQADNVRYVYNESENKWTPDSSVYYYDKITHVDIVGYYPYVSNIDNVNTYSFEVVKDQSTDAANGLMGGYEASDFLWGKADNISPTASRVNITLSHKMAGVQVELSEGTGWSENEWAGLDKHVLVSNTIRRASIDLANGNITPVGDVPTTGIVPAKSGEKWRAVVVPQTMEASMALLNIDVDGISYIYRKDSTYEYVAGKLHKFTIEVSKKGESGLEFKLVGEAITAWESETITHDGTAREYVVINVPAASTEKNVSALKAAIEASGKDYTKIKNLKITGEVNVSDFYFMRDGMTALQSINMKDVNVIEQEIPENAFNNKSTLVRFVFPNGITKISDYAFYYTSLSGALIIPQNVTSIGFYCFYWCTNITSLNLPNTLTYIGTGAFYADSGLSGNLNIPENVTYIGASAFSSTSFTGQLTLPNNLEYLGSAAFSGCSGFTGSLTIPNKISKIETGTFSKCSGLDGYLHLPQSVTKISATAFQYCNFRGELRLPYNLLVIGAEAFMSNSFSGTLKLPSSLMSLGRDAFSSCKRLTGIIEIPDEILIIPRGCFQKCSSIEGVILNKQIEQIKENAFSDCFQLNSIVCKATVPPTLDASAFSGVAKDNFVLEVPEASVAAYTLAPNWKEFKRVAAQRNFSISRNLFRTLNARDSKTLILRAESGATWSVESCPDWVTVSPSSGVGKTEITISVNEMSAGDVGTFDVETYDFQGSTTSTTYNGRAGEVVFVLDGKDYHTRTKVEQYDYEYGDGDVITNQTATKGKGVNLVFIGDCFDAQDIATGKYLNGMNEAIEHFFAIEPYATYKDYFNIYTIFGLSADSGVGSVNTIREAKFGSQYGLQEAGSVGVDENICFEYACKAPTVTEDNICQTTIVLVENTYEYDGITYTWGDGSAIALCPMSQDVYPYDFRGIVQHEAGGHAFGKLGDEYIYHNAFIQTCKCSCCNHVEEFNKMKSCGFYENISLTGNMYDVPWSHMILDPHFSSSVDIYEGGFFHARGVFRSESNSCMNNNVPYFSAISREAIVKRIMKYSGLQYSYDEFKANDIPLATEAVSAMTLNRLQKYIAPYATKCQFAPVFKGEKPNFKKSNK